MKTSDAAARTWINEFGKEYEVPPEIEAMIAAGKMTDSSWHNDLCPSFEWADGSVRLWIEHPDPEQRECGDRRFSVMLYDENHDYLDTVVSTERFAEVLAYLADHWDIQP